MLPDASAAQRAWLNGEVRILIIDALAPTTLSAVAISGKDGYRAVMRRRWRSVDLYRGFFIGHMDYELLGHRMYDVVPSPALLESCLWVREIDLFPGSEQVCVDRIKRFFPNVRQISHPRFHLAVSAVATEPDMLDIFHIREYWPQSPVGASLATRHVHVGSPSDAVYLYNFPSCFWNGSEDDPNSKSLRRYLSTSIRDSLVFIGDNEVHEERHDERAASDIADLCGHFDLKTLYIVTQGGFDPAAYSRLTEIVGPESISVMHERASPLDMLPPIHRLLTAKPTITFRFGTQFDGAFLGTAVRIMLCCAILPMMSGLQTVVIDFQAEDVRFDGFKLDRHLATMVFGRSPSRRWTKRRQLPFLFDDLDAAPLLAQQDFLQWAHDFASFAPPDSNVRLEPFRSSCPSVAKLLPLWTAIDTGLRLAKETM